MWKRALLTTVLLTVGLTAVLILDCTTGVVGLFSVGLSTLCPTVGFLAGDVGLWAGIGLGAFAVVGLVATWGQVLRSAWRQREYIPAKAFMNNLGRIADIGSQLADVDEGIDVTDVSLARLLRGVDSIEAEVNTDTIPTREAAQEWMRLLQKANALHNDGTLPTEGFKEVNTRLLRLFAVQEDDGDELSEASSH